MLKVCLYRPILIIFTIANYHSVIMKIFTSILVVLALSLIIYNATLLDFDNILAGDSLIGLIGIMASFCAVFIILIFRMSKILHEKTSH